MGDAIDPTQVKTTVELTEEQRGRPHTILEQHKSQFVMPADAAARCMVSHRIQHDTISNQRPHRLCSKDLDKHLEHLEIVLRRLPENGLYLKWKKCQFMQKEVQWLGHVISAKGISTDSEKIKVIREWPTPVNAREEQQSFMGLAGYYCEFIANFSRIAVPLTDFMQKEAEFKWRGRNLHSRH